MSRNDVLAWWPGGSTVGIAGAFAVLFAISWAYHVFVVKRAESFGRRLIIVGCLCTAITAAVHDWPDAIGNALVALVGLFLWWRRRRRGDRKRRLAGSGAAARARLAAMLRTLRDRGRRVPARRPVPVPG